MKTRIISLLLVFCIVLTLVPAALAAPEDGTASVDPANPFTDVKKHDWFYDAVQYARVNGFFNGTTATTFGPSGTMTRGMFVSVLGRMAGINVEDYIGQSDFSDVPIGVYYAPYVAWASKYDITSGTGNGKFSPDAVINRAQMATFFVRYFETFDVDYETDADITTYPADLQNVPSWAQDSVMKLWKQGLLNGDGVKFDPYGNASRAQAATLCMRTDEAVDVWYKAPGIPSYRVKLNPATGMPYDDPETYTVIYTDGVADERIFDDQTYTVEAGDLTPEFEGIPKRDGYAFGGWSPEVTKRVTKNVTYTAQWEVNKFTVTYTDGVAGELVFPDQVYPAKKNAATPDFVGTPTREGYTFKGWYPAVAATVTDDVTYTAYWEKATYTVTYTDGAGKTLFADQSYTVNAGADTPTLSDPSREGYTFTGWYPAVAATVTGNVTYTAQWKKNTPQEAEKFTVTYTDGVDGETVFADQVKTVERGKDTPAFIGNPSRAGYTFKGWNPDVAEKVTASVTYTAQWEAVSATQYYVQYTDGVTGTEVFEDKLYTVNAGEPTPRYSFSGIRQGYAFTGWSPEVAETVGSNVTYTAQWTEANIAVKFYDGDTLIDTLYAANGQPLGAVPSTEKTSKATGIFEGWYTDASCTTPFYADSPVTGAMNVYAKYTEVDGSELTITSFAQMDLAPNASFTVVGSGNSDAIVLTPKDGSDPVVLAITPTSGGYTITAEDGFTPGASYELTIPEGLNFVGSTGETLPETVRTASFSIVKEEVEKLEMSEHTHFVQHANPSALQAGSTVTVAGVSEGDLICFYHTTSPEDRDYTTESYMDDPETWFKAASVSGSTVTLAELEDSDAEKMYDVPDNFPVVGDPDAVTGTLTLEADDDGYTLDADLYAMMLTGDETITADLAYAKSKLSVGDFVSIYSSSAAIDSETDIYFGKITKIEGNTITYELSSAEEIRNAVDLYVKPALTGDDIVSQEAKAEIEQTVQAQIQDSGFAEEAAFMLAELATQTDGFRNMDSIQVLFTDENGEPLSDEEIALLNLGASFELSDDIELTVELITSGDQLHFEDKGSVQLAVGIDAKFEVEVEDDGKVCIDLSATFVQEMALGIAVNGELVKKEILFIPVPIGVKVGAAVDMYSYTGVRVDVQAYTVAPEDESLFDQFTDVISNPEKLADVLPESAGFAEIAEGLTTVGDVFDKIEELEGKIAQAQENVDTALGYAEDLENLWAAVAAMNTDKKYTRDEWKNLGAAFGKTNVSADLMEMLNLSTETELDADRYAESLEDLLTKYSEMLEKETDWVTLIEQEIGKFEYNYFGLVVFVKADFLVHADINIAMGANLQYQVGKRYNFWLKIGLFKPEAGSSTMDLVDEQFAFQFYVMGKLGLKMGIKGSVGFAIGSADVASVALALEVGPYVKLYGFFIYEYERMREANTSKWVSDERMAGALYLDFGLYLVVSVEAQALGLFEVSHDFVDEEFPLLEAGEQKYPYGFQYEPADDELVLVQDEDGNSTNGIKMTLPDEYRAVSYCNLVTGYMGATVFDWDHYNVYLSNPAFSVDGNGVITVDVPDNTRYMECDMVITYKYGKLAFSTYDMQVTVPLVWTNLATSELTQYYTASVRVGNVNDGYDTAWSKKVRKNEEFTLPTETELKDLIGYNDAIYSSFSGSSKLGQTTNIIANTSYDCTVAYTQYSITVSGVQNADGTTTSRTYYTPYGGTFDFSDLADTGTEIENTSYTKFVNVTTDATVTANGQTKTIDLNQPITGKVAEAVKSGISAQANYADDSVQVTYVFSGIEADSVSERIRKGGLPTYDIYAVAEAADTAVKSVTPELSAVSSNTTYYVECERVKGASYLLSFEENGGTAVNDITREVGMLIGTLPQPTREGYVFGGWYADEALTTEFTATVMPEADTTVYAKWTAGNVTVTFHVNGGNAWTGEEGAKSVAYGTAYGELPTPTKDGHGFQGWYTTQTCDEGTEVTAETVVDFTEPRTLYAKWHELVEIDQSFAYTAPETNPVYTKGVAVEINPNADSWPAAAEGAPALEQDSFTMQFMRQGSNAYEDGYPVNAGTYDVTITRAADDYYAPFSQTITGILTIEKASSSLSGTLSAETHGRAVIPTMSIASQTGDGALEYKVGSDGAWSNTGVIYDLNPGTYTVYARLGEGMNYNASDSIATTVTVSASNTFRYKLIVHTADEGNAGTDSIISAKIGDGNFVHLDNDGNDFERNDTDSYIVSVPTSLSIDGNVDVTIKFEKKGTAAGWKLGWLRMDIYDNDIRLYQSDQCNVYAWFEDSTKVETYTVTGSHLGRNVNTSSYGLQYSDGYITIDDTNISDNYKSDYDPYYYPNAPQLVAYFNDPIFNKYITRNSFTEFYVDWSGVRNAMDEYHVASPTLTYGIDYGVNGGIYGAADDMYTVTEANITD